MLPHHGSLVLGVFEEEEEKDKYQPLQALCRRRHFLLPRLSVDGSAHRRVPGASVDGELRQTLGRVVEGNIVVYRRAFGDATGAETWEARRGRSGGRSPTRAGSGGPQAGPRGGAAGDWQEPFRRLTTIQPLRGPRWTLLAGGWRWLVVCIVPGTIKQRSGPLH